MSWTEYDGGKTAGTAGTEGGTILKDEEHCCGARITLEDNATVTCGVYGAFVHTAFFGKEEVSEKYGQMKKELSGFLEREASEDEETEFYRRFADKY